ncbi:MAG: hypothetical protein AAFY34_16490, partial [Pseudomonadota bacterium]
SLYQHCLQMWWSTYFQDHEDGRYCCRLTEESDNNIDHLHDPENMLTTTSADNARFGILREFITAQAWNEVCAGNQFGRHLSTSIVCRCGGQHIFRIMKMVDIVVTFIC